MNDEWKLAEELQNFCDPSGVETFPKKSAKIFHKIGLQYLRKSPDKQSLIQSIALMTSAIIREPDNVDEIKQDLNQTWLHVLQLANAKQPDFLINEFVKIIKKQIIEMRNGTEGKLEALEKIPDVTDETELIDRQNVKIKNVLEIQNFVSGSYTKIMKSINDECLEIMGNALCRFSLVGMGSLARNEITPYSDFESVIILEEGVQLRSDYSKVLEYFRWFSTIFQMILVQLGETILRFLAIPCLNNPFDRKHNWFYDAHTPCGICPDGFAPPACKNPLGRQTPTRKKPWKTELIKPVSEMVKYLDSEEDLKNGYHLSDVLMKTCFVAGDESVHQEFCSNVDIVLFDQFHRQIFNILRQISENLKLFQFRGESLFPSVDTRDIKRYIYRSISVFICDLGRLLGIKESSCFEILSEMTKSQWITLSDSRKLMFALAVACEVRLRFYTAQKEQSDSMYRSNLFEGETMENAIGQKSLIDMFVTIWCFQRSIPQFLHQKYRAFSVNINDCKPKFILHESPLHLSARFCSPLGFWRTAERLCLERLHNQNVIPTKEVAHLLLIYANILYNTNRVAEAVRILKKNIPALRKANCIWWLCKVYFKLSTYNQSLGREKEAIKYSRKVNFYHFFGLGINICVYSCIHIMGKCYKILGRYKKALKYFDRVFRLLNSNLDHDYHDLYQNLIEDKIDCLLALGQYEEAGSIVNQKDYDKPYGDLNYSWSSFCAHVEKGESNFGYIFRDPLENLPDSVLGLQSEWNSLLRKLAEIDNGTQFLDKDKEYKAFLLYQDFLKKAELHESGKSFEKLCCMSLTSIALRLEQYEDVVLYGKRTLHELETSATNDLYSTTLETKGQLAQAYLGLEKYKEALSLLLDPRLVVSQSIHKECVGFYQCLSIAHCYTELKQHNKALEYFRKSFSLEEKMSTFELKMKLDSLSKKEAKWELTNQQAIHGIHFYTMLMITCLLNLEHYDEALYHCKKVWNTVSKLDWSYESATAKTVVLARLAQCHYFVGKAGGYTLNCANESLRLALEVYENPLAHDEIFIIAQLLIKTCRKFANQKLTWPHSYSPSLYSHFVDKFCE